MHMYMCGQTRWMYIPQCYTILLHTHLSDEVSLFLLSVEGR